MTINMPIVGTGAIVAIVIFAYMRNKQADRNDRRRERLQEKKDELIQMLKEKNNNNNEN